MKYIKKLIPLLFIFLLISCGGKDEKKEKEVIKLGGNTTETKKTPEKMATAAATIDMNNKGIGPIKSLTLPETIDQAMAKTGEEVFKAKCTACHKPTKKFIGPAPLGVLERRSPEWIMNMILNPDQMTQEDPVAKKLLIESNGSPMANQSLTEAEARSILEYFRTIKPE
jgi:mono/diheme cytochrome c family protein